MTIWGEMESKLFRDLAPDEIVWLHLNADPRSTKDMHILSSLIEAESTMRHVNTNTHSKVFGPVLAAFAILDQIGSTYSDRRRGPYSGPNTSILKALHYFGEPSLTAAEIENLYMFRNGLMHDAAFTSRSHKGVWHIYRYDNTLSRLIRLPARAWDGTATDVSDQTMTLLNLDRLVDMTSGAIDILRQLYGSADLEVHQSRDEISVKYLLWKAR